MTIYFPEKTGPAVSATSALLLTASAVCTAILLIWPATDSGLITFLSDNWLVLIFKLHASLIGFEPDPLVGISIYDIIFLALFIPVCYTLYAAFKRKNRNWYMTAVILIILGIILFIITRLAGRSSFMLSGLIISGLLLKQGVRGRIAGVTGITANILLLLGDFTVGTGVRIISVLFALGYLLLIVWLVIITMILLHTEKEQKYNP